MTKKQFRQMKRDREKERKNIEVKPDYDEVGYPEEKKKPRKKNKNKPELTEEEKQVWKENFMNEMRAIWAERKE